MKLTTGSPDAEIAHLASVHGPSQSLMAKGTTNMFHSLARNIAGQQLAIQAAKKIHERFMELCEASHIQELIKC